MPVGVNERFQITPWCQCGPQAGLMVHNLRVTAVGPNPLVLQKFADGWSDTLAPLLIPMLSSAAAYSGLILRQRMAGVLQVPYYSISSRGAGSSGAIPCPSQTCGLFTARTLLTGRKNRGRHYVPFPAVSSVEMGTLPQPDAGYMTLLGLLAFNLTTLIRISDPTDAMAWADCQPVVYHKVTDTQEDIVSAAARRAWATQRRRGAYGRTNSTPFS
jgi:hypothetical protein